MGVITNKQAEEQRLVRNKYYTAGSSMPEQFIYRSITQIFPETINRFKDPMVNMEYDIFITELKLYIEYNGVAFHNTEEKLERDKIKRLHCEKQKITFIQIIEDPEISEITKNMNGTTIIYRLNGNKQIKALMNDLITIIEDIFAMYRIGGVEIDYTRSFYEAMLLSNKYQYKINYDSYGDIAGKEYVGQVFCDYEISEKTELQQSRELIIKKVADTQKKDKLIQSEVDKLSVMMFNGTSLVDTELGEAISIQEKQRVLENKIITIDKKEKALEQKLKKLEEKERDQSKREELLVERENIIEKRQQQLNESAQEQLNRELNYRAIIEGDLQEREEKLQQEKETYQKKLESRYKKRLKQLNEEYEAKDELLKTYYKNRLVDEVRERTADIERISAGKVEILQEKLSQQRINAARQQMKIRYGLQEENSMTEIERIIKEQEESLKKKRENIISMREQYLDDREQLLELKEKYVENRMLEVELGKKEECKADPIEIAKSMLAEMSKELIQELKQKEQAYKEQVDREFDARINAAEEEIKEREKSKYDRALEKLREENQQLHRQLMSAKIGAQAIQNKKGFNERQVVGSPLTAYFYVLKAGKSTFS